MDLMQPVLAAPNVKIMINLGALLDITTGDYIEGRRGEYILNGGLSFLTGIVGIGNNFKSTVMHFMAFTAMARMSKRSTGNTYDTEVNVHENRLSSLARRIREFGEQDIITDGRWVVTDKTVYSGNEYYDLQKAYLQSKIKNAEKLSVDTPFWNRDRSGPFKMIVPTFSEMDSFTEFETDDVAKMQDENELGESGGNTIHMRQGLAKLRYLMEAPKINAGSYNYLLMTAHIGKESAMQSAGGGREVPIVKLKHLKNGDKIKGTTDKFTFITHNCWHCYDAKPLINDGTKGPEYPRNSDDNLKLDTDLNEVKLRNLRAKSGPTGMAITLIVSQDEGVLPSLTEFHHIKETGRYGLEGNVQNYSLALYPDCKLSRTTVRGKIDADAKLRRALQFTSEMCQMSYLWHDLEADGVLCSPKELYDDLIKLGYDWDIILQTRGYWTIEEEGLPPFLSTMDLLRMRQGKYLPYFLNEDKSVKKEYFDVLVVPETGKKIKDAVGKTEDTSGKKKVNPFLELA